MAKVEEIEVSVAEVVNMMRINNQFDAGLREAILRRVTSEAARKSGITVSDEELQDAADVFRIGRGLHKSEDMKEWLCSKGLSLDDLEQFLETSLLVAKFKDALEQKADRAKYLDSPAVRTAVKEMIWQDWLREQFE
ncbi:MAG: hypothetical protein ABFD98_09170 [Syntrophobacteraceae bacterium]|nr:SurA N-terminal domain-containing protein [Desulfobacteraceae bacterium]